MSGSCLAVLQTAVHGALTGDATLSALVSARIHDATDTNTAHPYITHGDSIEEKDETMGRTGKRAAFSVEVWSRYSGSLQVKEIAHRVAQVLDGWKGAVSGYEHVRTVHDRTMVQRDRDGISRWAAVWFTAFLREAA